MHTHMVTKLLSGGMACWQGYNIACQCAEGKKLGYVLAGRALFKVVCVKL